MISVARTLVRRGRPRLVRRVRSRGRRGGPSLDSRPARRRIPRRVGPEAPGRPWRGRPTRVGYARCSTAQQELQSQLDALRAAACDPVLSEKISSRIKVRPEFVKAMDYVLTIKTAVPHQRVIFVVHEMKRLGRGAAELLTIAEDLRRADIELELLTGPLRGIYHPSGHGTALFAFFAGMAGSEREYVREKFLEGQASARQDHSRTAHCPRTTAQRGRRTGRDERGVLRRLGTEWQSAHRRRPNPGPPRPRTGRPSGEGHVRHQPAWSFSRCRSRRSWSNSSSR